MTIERCKGSRDMGPEEMKRFRYIEDTFRDACEAWGYGEVKTPTLEYLHLFTSTGTLTPNMLGRVYSFLDWDGWSGERVVLRPDNTIPVARLYIESLANKGAARLFYVNNTFIFEPTGKTNRERWQCGAEFIGSGGYLADVELISLALKVLEEFGFENIDLRISHAGVIKAILKRAGLKPDDEVKVFDEILEGNGETIARLKSEKPELEPVIPLLLQMKGKSAGFLRNLKAILNGDFPELKREIDDFTVVTSTLEALGQQFQIDLTSGRGFEYYTGVMFQLLCTNEKVGGGGRYDALIPLMGGEKTPASGFALYMEPLIENINLQEAEIEEPHIGIIVGEGEEKEAFETADSLREEGYIVELCHDKRTTENIGWFLTIEKENEPYKLINTAGQSFEAEDIDGLLEILEEQSR